MRRNHSYFVFLAAVCLCAISHAAIYNGDFEIAEANGVPDYDGYLFYPPEGWQRENYAAVLERFIPDSNEGDYSRWKIDIEEGLRPVAGYSFVLLTTGDIDPNSELASLELDIYVHAGESISGYYFFGTLDWVDYPDWGTIVMVPNDPNNLPRSITLARVGVKKVGSYSSLEKWEYFEYTFAASEEGGYHLIIRVDDYLDDLFTSYFAVDGLTLCDTPLDGDINRDCRVNFKDFPWLATDWLKNCSDPNYFSDPNSNCYKGTDLNGDGPVDLNDLELMSDSWML